MNTVGTDQARLVRRIRDRLARTQAALARQLSGSRVTVARWETRVCAIPEPTGRLLQRIRNERREPRARAT